MEAHSLDRSRYVRLEVVEHDPRPKPDAKLGVAVQLRELVGKTSVWVDGNAIATFARAVDTVEKNREGRTELGSMTPGAFFLAVSAVDSGRQVLLEVAMRRREPMGTRSIDEQLSGGFELDPTRLSEMVADLYALAAEARQPVR